MTVELPPGTRHFVDRDEQRVRALRAVEEWGGHDRPLCLSLNGPGGRGKTELALKIAREVSRRFPDGVLWVDLDDYRVAGELDAGDVLGQLLDSLGATELSPSFKARCRQYRKLTAGRRMILVVDNARYASEVVQLLPSTGDGLVIVASHGPLYDLADGAAVDLALPPLEDTAAMELLARLVEGGKLAADHEAAIALVRLCSGLPAALLMAAGWVRNHPLWSPARLLAELSAELREKGVPGVEPLWDAAYGAVGARAALLYRLLAGTPGITFDRESATALLGLGPEACEDTLEKLGEAGLADIRALYQTEGGRVRLPEHQRAHALRRARLDAAEGELAEAQLRLVRWVLRQGQRADRFAAGTRLVVAEAAEPVPGAPDVPLADPADTGDKDEARRRKVAAARWLYAERHALFACVTLAYARGWDTEAWALSEPVWTYFLDHPHQADVTEVFRTAVAAAVRAGYAPAIVRTRSQLARALWESGQTDEAAKELAHAMAALELLGGSKDDLRLRASAIEFRGMLGSVRGDWAAAAQDFAQSREVHRSIPNPYGVMLQTYRLGQAQAELGDLAAAEQLLTEAHRSAGELGRERLTARTGFALGHVLRRLGRSGEARRLYQQSLDAARERGSDSDEARVLDASAALADEEGHSEEAGRHRAAARAIRQRSGLD